MAQAIFVVLSWLAAITAYGETPDSIDAGDNVVYTDASSLEGGISLKLPSVNISPVSHSFPNTSVPIGKPKRSYQLFSMVSPRQNDTVYINANNLAIKIRLLPPLKTELGHTLQILFDEEVLAEDQLSYLIDDATAGEHTISARIINEDEQTIANIPNVTVHIEKPFAP